MQVKTARPVGRPAPALGPWREWIDEILIADRTAPRKQRHTVTIVRPRSSQNIA